MDRISEGIEDGGDFPIDAGTMPPDICHRQGDQFGKRSWPIHAHAKRVGAEMASSSQAIAAASADHVTLAADDVAAKEVADVRADFNDLADKLVADGHRYGYRLLCPLVPLVNVNVRAADTGVVHPNQHVVDADRWLGDTFKPKPPFGLPLD